MFARPWATYIYAVFLGAGGAGARVEYGLVLSEGAGS